MMEFIDLACYETKLKERYIGISRKTKTLKVK